MLRRLATDPTSASEMMVAQVLSYLLIGAVQALLVMRSGFALGYRPDNGISTVALGLVIASVFSVCNVGFGLMTASLARAAGAATGISFLFLLPQMFLGDLRRHGAFVHGSVACPRDTILILVESVPGEGAMNPIYSGR